MPAYRFYIPKPFEQSQELILEGDEFHHLKNVMRHKEGDSIEVINGMGGFAFAEISEIKKRHATILITETKFFQNNYNMVLLQAIPKINKLELIIEKGTELGMGELHLFKGEKSSQKLTEEKLLRLQQKAISALKQSGRYYLPTIKFVPPISDWESSFQHAYYGDVNTGSLPFYKALQGHTDLKTLYFCNGPESGFSEKEIASLKQKKFQGISLHTNVLRTETASFVFLSLIHHYLLIHGDGPVIN